MSKQELYAWTSAGMTVSILVFYFLIAFGWPDGIPDYSSQAVKIFFNVFWIAFIGEIILDATEKKKGVEKDERDTMIDARGFRNAYNFMSVVIAVLLVQVLLSKVFGHFDRLFETMNTTTFMLHVLFIVLMLSSLVRRTTQLYYYRRDY